MLAPNRRSRLVLVTLALLALPAVALAHLGLRSSTPRAGAMLMAQPAEIRIVFTQAVRREYVEISLTAPDGAAVALGPVISGALLDSVFVAAVPPLSAGGSYRIRWKTLGADGAVVQGEIPFMLHLDMPVAPDTAAAAHMPPGDMHDEHDAMHGTGDERHLAGGWAGVAARFLNFVALLAMIGAVVFRAAVLSRAADPELFRVAERRTWAVARAAATLALVALLLRLGLQSAEVHGTAQALDPDRISTMLAITGWGRAWVLQALATSVFLVGLVLVRTGRAFAGWTLAAVASLALAVVPALSGHAASMEERRAAAIVADGVHVLAAGGWMGGLLLLLVAGVPASMLSGRGVEGAARLTSAFSPVALGCAATLALTGTIAGVLHLPSIGALLSSGYGRTLLLKLAILGGVLALGFYNWRVLRPRLQRGAAAPADLRRSATIELAIGTAVVVVTAILVGLPTP